MSAIPLLSYFCTPVPGQSWGALEVFAKCKRLVVYAVVQGSCNIALDIFIFLLPLPTIFGLHLPLKKKLGVLTIFGTGFLYVYLGFRDSSGIMALTLECLSVRLLPAALVFTIATNSRTVPISTGMRALLSLQRTESLLTYKKRFTNSRASSVEINIAIICSSMPACSSFAKHVFEKSSLFGSFRSLFNQYILSSKTKGSSKKSKSSYDSSYPAGVDHSERSMGSKTLLPENGYVELQEAKSYVRTNQISATDGYHQSTRSHPYQQGITRTVEMDIV